jgi:hypothetical protein
MICKEGIYGLRNYLGIPLRYIKIFILITKKIDDNSIIWVGSNFTLFQIIHKLSANLLSFVRFSETLNCAGHSKIVIMNDSV